MHLTYFDFAVFAILAASAALSFFRGLVREMLSLGAWLGAGMVTLYLFPKVAVVLEKQLHNTMIASGFAALLTFLVALIFISLIGSVVMKFVKPGSDIGLLDNGMGMLFGLARGGLVIAIGFYLFTLGVTKKDYPAWLHDAYTLPYVTRAATVVSKVAPAYLDDIAGKPKKESVAKEDAEISEPSGRLAPDREVAEEIHRATEPSAAPESKKSTLDWPSPHDLERRIQASDKADPTKDK